MRVALTGASGFVGKAVLPLLLAAGHDVRALYRTPPEGDKAAVRGDLASRDALGELVSKADVVLHIAGAVQARNTDAFRITNVEGTENLLAAAIKAGVKRFVHVSSLAARMPELSPYAASKRAGEQVLLARDSELQVLMLRPAAVYGPGDTATLPLLKQLMAPVAFLPGRRDARFSLVHVDDLAVVCVQAVEREMEGLFEIDDLSGGYGWKDLVTIVNAQFGRPSASIHVPRPVAMGLGFAAENLSRLTRNSAMLTTGKVREMYQPSWLTEGPRWPRDNPIPLAVGLPQTIRWHQERGTLPKTGRQPRTPETGKTEAQ